MPWSGNWNRARAVLQTSRHPGWSEPVVERLGQALIAALANPAISRRGGSRRHWVPARCRARAAATDHHDEHRRSGLDPPRRGAEYFQTPPALCPSPKFTDSAKYEVRPPPLGATLETALTFDRLFLGREGFPNTGVINIRALDCQNAPAPGVQFRLEPAAVSWYYVGEIPVGAARATTESGVGGFSDVGPGTVVVTAELVEPGRQLAPPQSAFVRGGWFTNIRFRH